jgi:hypothetical protein
MDPEREKERQTYQLCRLGFAILSIALAVACLIRVLALPSEFGVGPFLPGLKESRFWHWSDVPVVWGCLFGWYLLWGRWENPSWQRRAGLLLVMGLVDVVLWGLDHGPDFGLAVDDLVGHEWLRYSLGSALGWAEFALIAGLSCEVMVHLGVEAAAETGMATRALVATGAVIWMADFCLQTDWRSWPLEFRGVRSPEAVLLRMGTSMIWTVALIQVTALSFAATRQCGEVLADMDREEKANDPLRSASEDASVVFPGLEGPWDGVTF